ncbi:MAG: type I glyceraldehyde-3-phosphate dehydrogenase [Flavobacteriales bacterium]|nr:type I glyceraldehyde-3-phosphate dehydrogenase [Flavobacteriales bacterium]
MKKIKVAINGYGRIGRITSRVLANAEDIELVAINDKYDAESLAHLFKYDTVHRVFPGEVSLSEGRLHFGNQAPLLFATANPADLPWGELDVDIVLECTGMFKSASKSQVHIDAGAKQVLISAPPEDDSVKTIVLGVNEDSLDGSELVVSNASCTTNSAAPMIQLLNELCDIESCYITTVHSYTGDQHIQDRPHRDLRRGRAAAESIVPTTTGAAKALTRIFPGLSDVMGGCGIRVPVPDGSLTDITCIVKNPIPVTELNAQFEKAAKGRYPGVFQYTEDPIVSSDIIGNSHSCIMDGLLTSVIGNMVKIVGWYDNEMGYSHRMVDMIRLLAKA